eukprot:Em0017g853a
MTSVLVWDTGRPNGDQHLPLVPVGPVVRSTAATCLAVAVTCLHYGPNITTSLSMGEGYIYSASSLVYKEVVKEPIMQQANEAEGVPSLIVDLSIRGVWQPQTVALLVYVLMPRCTHNEMLLPFSLQLRKKRRNALKQQLFAEPPSHLLLCQLMESWVEKQIFLSNNMLRNLPTKIALNPSGHHLVDGDVVLRHNQLFVDLCHKANFGVTVECRFVKQVSRQGQEQPLVESYGNWGLEARQALYHLVPRLPFGLGYHKSKTLIDQ